MSQTNNLGKVAPPKDSPVEASLPELAQQARDVGSLAFDTEFISEARYFSQLCLVQFAVETAEGVSICVVDTIADHDPAPVMSVLADPAIEIVVHAGQQDLALLRRVWDAQITNVFDTQVAAAFAGPGFQRSYQDLVGEFLDLTLQKGESLTYWDRRPLTPEQLAYAREDVEYLPRLALAVRERLESIGRLQWACDESHRVAVDSGERDPEDIFRRIARSARLPKKGSAVARELVFWREQTAREDDRPVKWVLPDNALTQLARRRPKAVKQLTDIRGVGEGAARRYGQQIIAAIERGEQGPPAELEPFERFPQELEPLAALAQAFVRARAQEEDIAAQLVATRVEIDKIVRTVLGGEAEPSTPLMSGWRRELAGAELLELLRGNRSVSVNEKGWLRTSPSA